MASTISELAFATLPDEDRSLLAELRARAESSIGSVRRYHVPWAPGGVTLAAHGDYVRR